MRGGLPADGGPLKLDNGKTARLSLGPVGGGAIKLSAEVTTGLTVGEGVETVLAGMMAPTRYRPAWALISSGNLETFPVLAGIESLTILVDHDRRDQHGRRAGQKAAAECARRWDAAGREVVAVIPQREGHDMADIGRRS
jgi:putative DNA primase/helicase